MLRKVSIGWLRQRSGMFALKGITISENESSYDSTNNFREEDAEWLTTTLGAEASVEISGRKEYSSIAETYPKWASASRQATDADATPPIMSERANATLFRHLLEQIVKASTDGGEEGNAMMQKLVRDADSMLRSTDCGTHYSLDQALAILTKYRKKLHTEKVAPR